MTKKFQIVFILLALTAFDRSAHARNDPWIEVTSPHFRVSSDSGEKDARRVARECEEIRAVFLADHPTLRVDGGRPLIVIAVKDEDALKVLLPDYWAEKDHVRPPGAFKSYNDEDFAVLRTDVAVSNGINPYYALYEEYVFSLLRLNYGALPLWLRTGLADYYGNTLIDDKYTELGHPINWQIALLQRSQLIPLFDLLNADSRSPLVNDRDKQSLFYAESWAIVHYLALSPDIANQDLLNKYLKSWRETGDSTEAARRTFGDLKKFESKIDDYCYRLAFHSLREPTVAKQKALDAALKAHQLEPAMLAYVVDVGDALIALDRDSDARAIRDTLNKDATTPAEKNMSELFSKRLAHYEESAKQGNDGTSAQASPADVNPGPQPPPDQPQP